MLLHLDFETFGILPLAGSKGVSTHRYLQHHSTEVDLAGWALNDEAPSVEEGPRISDTLRGLLLRDDVIIVAFNAEFERLVLQYVLGITLPPERFLCTMALLWSASFVGGLDKICAQVGLGEDERKLKEGRRLMLKFSQPRRPSKNDPRTRWTKEMDPAGWEQYRQYCGQDVVASRALYRWFNTNVRACWHPREREMWCLDQRINDTGWPLDMNLVRNANAIRIAEEQALRDDLGLVTGLENANSTQQFSAWLEDQGVPMLNLQKDTVATEVTQLEAHVAANPEDSSVMPALDALRLRQQLARATPKKWDALHRCATQTAEGLWVLQASLEFAAAQRTQRWGGRVFQPQNLYAARGWSEAQIETLVEILTHADRRTLRALFGDTMSALSSGIRSAVAAPEGEVLMVYDFGSIESRSLGWLSGCERINSLFAAGKDTYRDLASRLFNIPYDKVTKEQRNFSKPPDLGCCYMLGGPGLVAYADGMGVTMDEDFAQYAVDIWRESNPEVVKMWYWLQDQMMHVIQYGGRVDGYAVTITRDENFLYIRLPSGRDICYYQPMLQEIEFRGRQKLSITYMGRTNEKTGSGAWVRVSTHPGKVTENINQALCRDLLRDSLLNIWKDLAAAGLLHLAHIVGHVHDEAVLRLRNEVVDVVREIVERRMSEPNPSTPGLLLAAEGFTCKHYQKG